MNAKTGEEAIVPGVSPQVYSHADFDRIASMVRREAGIVLSDGKKMLAYSRLAPLLRKTGCATFAAFLEEVERDKSLSTSMIAALTTNHTYFNREEHHFSHFAQEVRPDLIERSRSGLAVRLWSAGCSSGEEIWTLMMVLLGEDRAEGRRIASGNVLALASDLAEHAVAAGIQGRYDSKAIEAVPQELRNSWTRPVGDKTEIAEDLRALVRFRLLNLLGSWPFANLFDVIFCRNVMIYFDHATKEQLVWRLVNQLRPGGHLYIGHSERATGKALDLLELVGPTIYRRRHG
nr:CheR family methyltransferase [Aurantiacibacter sp. 219JJ12-13]MDP5262386.1 CheR family methyltransferase [Aurantiacibacter sp. 219JJ12-13]